MNLKEQMVEKYCHLKPHGQCAGCPCWSYSLLECCPVSILVLVQQAVEKVQCANKTISVVAYDNGRYDGFQECKQAILKELQP